MSKGADSNTPNWQAYVVEETAKLERIEKARLAKIARRLLREEIQRERLAEEIEERRKEKELTTGVDGGGREGELTLRQTVACVILLAAIMAGATVAFILSQ